MTPRAFAHCRDYMIRCYSPESRQPCVQFYRDRRLWRNDGAGQRAFQFFCMAGIVGEVDPNFQLVINVGCCDLVCRTRGSDDLGFRTAQDAYPLIGIYDIFEAVGILDIRDIRC